MQALADGTRRPQSEGREAAEREIEALGPVEKG
jgi:hypothetical protein